MMREITAKAGPWSELLLVCRKCSRKLDGGFGPKERDDLPHLLKQMLRDRRRRRDVRVLAVGCLGVCPKDAVTVLRGAAPGEMLVVPRGTAPDRLADRLGLPAAAEPGALGAPGAQRGLAAGG